MGIARDQHFEPKLAALPDHARHANPALHEFDQALANNQADAGAFRAAGFLAEAIERLEQLRQVFRRQTRTGVLDADANPVGKVHHAVHADRAVGLVVFDRVGKQIDDHLFYAGAVGLDIAGIGEGREGHADAALLCLRFDHRLTFHHYIGQ